MGARGSPTADDNPTVDLGPRPTSEPAADYDDDEFGNTEAESDVVDTATAAAPRDSVHALPTQQLPLRGKRPTGATTSLTKMSGSGSIVSPLEVMCHDKFEDLAPTDYVGALMLRVPISN